MAASAATSSIAATAYEQFLFSKEAMSGPSRLDRGLTERSKAALDAFSRTSTSAAEVRKAENLLLRGSGLLLGDAKDILRQNVAAGDLGSAGRVLFAAVLRGSISINKAFDAPPPPPPFPRRQGPCIRQLIFPGTLIISIKTDSDQRGLECDRLTAEYKKVY